MREDRLALLNSDFVQRVAESDARRVLVVRETNEGGQASIEFSVPEGTAGLALRLCGSDAFPYLKSKKNADGYLLTRDACGTWNAHLVECKSKLVPKELRKALAQLDASVARLQILCDFLGISIGSWMTWVAYKEDQVSAAADPDPYEVWVRDRQPEPSERELWAAGLTGQLSLIGSVPLQKISLDPVHGTAQVTLPEQARVAAT